MGMIPGAPDFIFTWNEGCSWLELKSPKGRLSPAQKEFAHWCDRMGVPWGIARSVQEVEDHLMAWGVLKPTKH